MYLLVAFAMYTAHESDVSVYPPIISLGLQTARSSQVVVNSIGALSTGCVRTRCVDWNSIAVLRSSIHMLIVPHLIEIGASIVRTVRPGRGGIISWSAAADIGNGTILLSQRVLHITQCVCRGIAGSDAGLCEPVIGRIALVVHDGRLIELDDLLVVDIFGPIAWHIESGVACGVLAEFMSPEGLVGRSLVDPVLVHVCQQVVLAKCLDERVDAGAIIRRNDGAVWKTICGIWTGLGVKLPAEIAVLSVGAVAEIGPETMKSPRLGWDQLTFGFETGVGVPELCLEKKAAISLGAACVSC